MDAIRDIREELSWLVAQIEFPELARKDFKEAFRVAGEHNEHIDRATQAINNYILSEIIGEDELTTGNEFTYRGDGKSHREIEVENFLRARQRNKLLGRDK